MRLPQNLTKSIKDCKTTYAERTDLYYEECKGIVIDATRIECCDLAKNSTYCQICSNKMVTQKKRCPHFLCHKVTTENLLKPYPQARQKPERNETHDIKLDGKNRMELNVNDRGAYKHRPSEQNQRHYNEHRAAIDMNRITL